MCRSQTLFKMKRRGTKRQHQFDVVNEIREDVVASISAEDNIREGYEKLITTKVTPEMVSNLPPKMVSTYFVANYNEHVISYVTSFLPKLRLLPVSIALEGICNLTGCPTNDASFIFNACSSSHDVLWKVDQIDFCLRGFPLLLTPPTKTFLLCSCSLSQHNRPCDVTVHTARGKITGQKFSLRCTKCDLNYNYDRYGNTTKGLSLYEERRPLVEASDVCFIDRKLVSFQCALA